MTYWELETEEWETVPDNYDGAETITMRGRLEHLEKSYCIDYQYEEYTQIQRYHSYTI